jgi:hypothetical protein
VSAAIGRRDSVRRACSGIAQRYRTLLAFRSAGSDDDEDDDDAEDSDEMDARAEAEDRKCVF